MTILETLSGLLNSRRQAKTLIDELKARGLVIVEDDEFQQAVRNSAMRHEAWVEELRRNAIGKVA